MHLKKGQRLDSIKTSIECNYFYLLWFIYRWKRIKSEANRQYGYRKLRNLITMLLCYCCESEASSTVLSVYASC